MSESSNRDSGTEQATRQRDGANAGAGCGLSLEQEKTLACLNKDEPIKTAAQALSVAAGSFD